MMKYFLILMLLATLTACSPEPEKKAEEERPEAIYVLVENGGSVQPSEQEAATTAVYHLLQQLMELDQRRATRHVIIHIVLSALPNRISFTGKPAQLRENVARLKSLITFKEQSFSDLVMAYKSIKTSIALSQPSAVSIYHIGSVINIPYSQESEISVKVPQAIPDDLALPEIMEMAAVKTLKFYRVHPDQTTMLQEYLQMQGILQRSMDGTLDFALMGAAQTTSRLTDLL